MRSAAEIPSNRWCRPRDRNPIVAWSGDRATTAAANGCEPYRVPPCSRTQRRPRGPKGNSPDCQIGGDDCTKSLRRSGGPIQGRGSDPMCRSFGPWKLKLVVSHPNLTVWGYFLPGGTSAGAGRPALRMPRRFVLRSELLFEPEPQPVSGSQANRLTGACHAAKCVH
jgi:hypothetical protein